MDPNMTLQDCFRLARTMTWKWAMADIFLGGGAKALGPQYGINISR